jgi:uncharacterized protein with von Willebrand factor type A (vWA) domain
MINTPLSVDGRLAENIIYFCHALRRAEVPVGSAQVNDAIRAVQAVGFTKRVDFFMTLRACLITRVEHLLIFQRVFDIFWRDPEILESMIQNLLPMMQTAKKAKKPKAAENRAAEAVLGIKDPLDPKPVENEIILDAQYTISSNERLNAMDFEKMTNLEIREAEKAIAGLHLKTPNVPSRRLQSASYGARIDARAVLREARRTGGEILKLPRQIQRHKPPALVILTDISGSMSTYSRMMMHFIHSMSLKRKNDWAKIHAFTFGTRLTNITRSFNHKDPDKALQAIGQQVQDWDGGTLIGESLAHFNKDWSRRVLSSDTCVLLITDGLERDAINTLQMQMRRLSLSCRHLIWLNPLLRFGGFEAKAIGIQTMLPFVDSFLACHNLNAMQDLTNILNTIKHDGQKNRNDITGHQMPTKKPRM